MGEIRSFGAYCAPLLPKLGESKDFSPKLAPLLSGLSSLVFIAEGQH